MKFATFAGLVATASADMVLNIPAEAWDMISTDEPNGGNVSFNQCDDDMGAFTFDADNTKVTPDPVKKGDTIKFHLAGIVSDPIEVTNVHVHVDWNGSSLWDEDHKQDNKYDSQYSYDLQWAVPSFAPSGQYDIHLTGIGSD